MAHQEGLEYREESNLHFNSKAYLQRYTDPQNPLGYHAAFLKGWHTFYQEHGKEFDPTKATMLEFGGGPAVWDLISVAPFVSSITFTDFADTNRAEIELWKNNNSECHNWKPYIEHVVRTLEGISDPNAVDLREQEIRDKIHKTAPCDARADKPLGDIQEKFDVIHTNLCLEAVCKDKEDFYRCFKNVCQYLKPKGYILLGTACGCRSYQCWKGEDSLYVLGLESEDLDIACKMAGLTLLTKHINNAALNTITVSNYHQFTVAQKN